MSKKESEMNELKFNSQICTTKEQSQRLLKLGLKPETADMHHYKWSEGYWDTYTCPPRGSDSCYIPAWSLHRLIEIYSTPDESCVVTINGAFDDLIDDIEWCINKGYLNKEYLCEDSHINN